MFSKLRLRKGIAYLLIWLQLLTPGLPMLPMGLCRISDMKLAKVALSIF